MITSVAISMLKISLGVKETWRISNNIMMMIWRIQRTSAYLINLMSSSISPSIPFKEKQILSIATQPDLQEANPRMKRLILQEPKVVVVVVYLDQS